MFALLHSLSERRGSNLSSAIRVFVLEHYIDARHRQMLPVKEESDHTSLPRLLPRPWCGSSLESLRTLVSPIFDSAIY